MRVNAAIAIVVAPLLSCHGKPGGDGDKALDLPAFVVHAVVLRRYGNGCLHDLEVCGEVIYLPCDAAVDGPAYYLRAADGSQISKCGGACWHPHGDQIEVCRTLCPPATSSSSACVTLTHSP